jgi:membrane protein implicated in regulation of membrane protease activity
MDAWGWWFIAAALLVAGEILTLDLILAMLAGGAVGGGAVAALDEAGVPGTGPVTQGSVALAAALVGLLVLRPIAVRHLKRTPVLRTGVARLVGADAVVLEEVGPQGGRIRLDGEIWSARSYDGSSVFESGAGVSVLQIEGATALVG